MEEKCKVMKVDIDIAFGAVEAGVEAIRYDLAEECYTPATYCSLIEAVKELELKWDKYLSQHSIPI